MITSTGATTVGGTRSLNCSLNGATDPVTYQWFDGNGTRLTNVSQLLFSPLRPSHAGTYTCRATVGSVTVEGSSTVTIICKNFFSFTK